jgi:hypothetical protein
MPPEPRGVQIMIRETAVKGTVVTKMPKGGIGLLDWVMLVQPGPKSLEKMTVRVKKRNQLCNLYIVIMYKLTCI